MRQWFATPEAAKPAGHQPPQKSTGEQEAGTVAAIWNPKDEQAGWLLPRHTQVLEAGDETLLQSLTPLALTAQPSRSSYLQGPEAADSWD